MNFPEIMFPKGCPSEIAGVPLWKHSFLRNAFQSKWESPLQIGWIPEESCFLRDTPAGAWEGEPERRSVGGSERRRVGGSERRSVGGSFQQMPGAAGRATERNTKESYRKTRYFNKYGARCEIARTRGRKPRFPRNRRIAK